MIKRNVFLLLIGILALTLLGCDFFGNNSDDTEVDASLSETVSNFPTPKLQLSRSLQLDSGDDAIRTLQSRTFESVDDTSLPPVYSTNWYNMQIEYLTPDDSMTGPLELLRDYAATHEINAGEVIDFGVVEVDM